jgi:hypothetical protein
MEESVRLNFCIPLAVLALLVSLPAQARGRDDVMSRAFRCAPIGDTRQWLDCYYGAAQPLRARLGLPPAPQSQTQLVEAPPIGGNPADVPIRDEVVSAAFRCNALTEERQWLDCYYMAAQSIRARLGLLPLPTTSSPQLADSYSANLPTRREDGGSEQQFGRPLVSPTTSRNFNGVVSPVTTYSFDRNGFFTLKLANGQRWRQLTGDTSFAHWSKPAHTYSVNITHGALGSYNLRVQDGPGVFKVERIE